MTGVAPQTKYAHNGDVNIAYRVVGDGPIDLLWVSGFVSNIEAAWEIAPFRAIIDRLSTFTRLIMFDKRSQGASDRFPEPPTLEQSMEDARAVLDAAGSKRAAVFGISEGGPMSILLAASVPERISALILYGTYARVTEAPGYDAGLPDQMLTDFSNVIRRDWGGPVAIDLFMPSVAEDEEARAWWSRLLRGGSSPNGAAALLELYRRIDVRDVLPSLHLPTLVLHSQGDVVAPEPLGRYLAEHIPDAKYVTFPGPDHIPATKEHRDALLDEIEEFLTGHRSERIPNRVLATVMFTDIVGSTERAAELGDKRWRELIERHDELMRAQIDDHRGRMIKTMGDGVLATFDGPARAIDCACSAREAVRPLGVDIRAGLHTGECELIGGDVGGMAVNIGARVGASAGPGEVLVSRTVTDLVVGSGLEFEDRGVHSLKGVPGDWHLYALRS